MTVEERDRDRTMGTKNIVSVDPKAEVTPIRNIRDTGEHFEEAELHRQSTDRVKDKKDHKMLTNALADALWERRGNKKLE